MVVRNDNILHIILTDINENEKFIYIIKDINSIKGVLVDCVYIRHENNVTLIEIQNNEVIIDKNEIDDIMNNENSKIISLTELKNMFNNLIII